MSNADTGKYLDKLIDNILKTKLENIPADSVQLPHSHCMHGVVVIHRNGLAFYRLELDENGKLMWEEWLEQKLTERESHTLNIMMNHILGDIRMMPGYTFYMRNGYRYTMSPEGTYTKEQNLDFINSYY